VKFFSKCCQGKGKRIHENVRDGARKKKTVQYESIGAQVEIFGAVFKEGIQKHEAQSKEGGRGESHQERRRRG